MPSGDIVETAADADGLTKPPLLVLDRVRGVPRRARPRDGRRCAHAGSARVAARTSPSCSSGDRARFVLRRPPRPPLPPSAHDVVREARLQLALREAGFARLPTIVAVCEDETPARRALLRHGRPRRGRADRRAAARARGRAAAPCARRRPRRRARRDPRGRRGDAGSRRVRAAGELQRAPGSPLRAALGDQQDARAPARSTRSARGSPATLPDPLPLDGRPRRLPAREHDGRHATSRRGSSPCSTGRWGRSATRAPTSATCSRRTASPAGRRTRSARRP